MEFVWSSRYLRDMEKLPRWLPVAFWKRACGGIDRAAAVAALNDGKDLAQVTLDRRSSMVMAVVNYREKHRRQGSIHILTRDLQQAVFASCQTAEERWAVALLLYAGIRPDAEDGEIRRMDWSDVGKTSIHIREEASKTGTDRIIPIAPVLREMLKGHPPAGSVVPAGWRRSWQRIRKESGIGSMQDVLRHTFASHFLMWRGEEATKAAMGHTANSVTLFRHYRKAVTKGQAEKFFKERADQSPL